MSLSAASVAPSGGGCVGVVAVRSQTVVQPLVRALFSGGLRCSIAVRITFVAGQTLEPSAGLAVSKQVVPRWAGALEAARHVDALVGTGLWKPRALIYVCSQHKERPAPGTEEKDGVRNV